MRLITISTSLLFVLTSPVYSADLGQYRAGNAYQSVISPNANVCESHCVGEAQCRSWNYVKANPRAQGVCEFNVNDVAPTPSAISISGSNAAKSYSSNVVSGTTNTIRVGGTTAPQASVVEGNTNSQRRIIREPVPQLHQAQTASTRQSSRPSGNYGQVPQRTLPQNYHGAVGMRASTIRPVSPSQYRAPQGQAMNPQHQNIAAYPPRFRHDLGGRQLSQPRINTRQQINSNTRPIYPHAQNAQGYSSITKPHNAQFSPKQLGQNGAVASQNYLLQNRQMQQTQNELRINQQANQMVRRSASDPITYGAQSAQSAPQSSYGMPMPQNQTQSLSAEQAQRSLFGKLNDDVRVPNSGSPIPPNSNMAIPTQASRPSTPVQKTALDSLAGAPQ